MRQQGMNKFWNRYCQKNVRQGGIAMIRNSKHIIPIATTILTAAFCLAFAACEPVSEYPAQNQSTATGGSATNTNTNTGAGGSAPATTNTIAATGGNVGTGGAVTSTGGNVGIGGFAGGAGATGNGGINDPNTVVTCNGYSFQQDWVGRYPSNTSSVYCMNPGRAYDVVFAAPSASRVCPTTVQLQVTSTGNGLSTTTSLPNGAWASLTAQGFCWDFGGNLPGDRHVNFTDQNGHWGQFADLVVSPSFPFASKQQIEHDPIKLSYGVTFNYTANSSAYFSKGVYGGTW
jgi:hypothetical protein